MIVLALMCACTAAWLWIPPKTAAVRLARLQRVSPPPPRKPARGTIISLTAAVACALAVGGIPGILAGATTFAAVTAVLRRREPPEKAHLRHQVTTDLPFAADLMAACLRAGHPVTTATSLTADAIAGPLGERLSWVAAQLRLGAEPEPTWATLATDPSTAPLGRAMTRAAQSGAPVADVLTRLADDGRATIHATSVAAARAVGVKAVAPLGLCFLPAFVLLGIIPIVAGLASNITLP